MVWVDFNVLIWDLFLLEGNPGALNCFKIITLCFDGQWAWRYIPNGQNHPAYNFNGCSVLCFSTRAFAAPVASGWRSASGGGIVMFLILAKA